MQTAKDLRHFLKADLWQEWDRIESDQKKRKPHPPAEKPAPADAELIDLVPPESFTIGSASVIEAIRRRRSHRQYASTPLTLEELSFLLWATQGVREVLYDGRVTLRMVPSAGARHPFETYVHVQRVEGLTPGLHRYLPIEHKLYLLATGESLSAKIWSGTDSFARDAAAIFLWTAIPYRTEWRYGVLSPKLIALDAGHLCQNLYLACEAIGAGTCAIGAYNQKELDEALGVDGDEEFVVYTAPVGKI